MKCYYCAEQKPARELVTINGKKYCVKCYDILFGSPEKDRLLRELEYKHAELTAEDYQFLMEMNIEW